MNAEDKEFLSIYVEAMRHDLEHANASVRLLIEQAEDVLSGVKQPDKQSYNLGWRAFLDVRSLKNHVQQTKDVMAKGVSI
jgi:hypothetical protein